MAFNRIEGLQHPISALEDRVQGRAAWLKEYFDRSPTQLMEAFNALVDALNAGGSAGLMGAVLRGNDAVMYIRLNDDNALETSCDGETWQAAVSVVDGSGAVAAHNADGAAHADIRADVLSAQTAADNAQATANTKAAVYAFTATLGTEWAGDEAPYTQTVAVPGVTAAMNPFWDIMLSGVDAETARARLEAGAMLSYLVTNNGSITVTCLDEKPTVELPIQMKEVI